MTFIIPCFLTTSITCCYDTEFVQNDKDKFSPVIVNRETLLSMDSSLVLVCERPEPLRFQYYRNLVPELQIVACSSCYRVSKPQTTRSSILSSRPRLRTFFFVRRYSM